jgi:hypothetical protein
MGVFDVVNFIRAQVVNFWLAPKHPEKFAPEPSPECWQGGFRVARFVVPYGYNTVAPARYHASIRLLKKKRAQPNHGVM